MSAQGLLQQLGGRAAIVVLTVLVDACANPGALPASAPLSDASTNDGMCSVANALPDQYQPYVPCYFYENNSTQPIAMIEASAGGHGFGILEACFRSGVTADLGAPWDLQLGVPAQSGEAIAGDAVAHLISADIKGDGPVILKIEIPASGPPTFEQLSAPPVDYVGDTC